MTGVDESRMNVTRLIEAYPHLKFPLWEYLQLAASRWDCGYVNEEEYVRDLEFQLIVRGLIIANGEALNRPTELETNAHVQRLKLIEDLRVVYDSFEPHIISRLENPAATMSPRLPRLAVALDLSPSEASILKYLLVSQIGTEVRGILGRDFDRSFVGTARFLGLSLRCVVRFADPSRRHMRERLVLLRGRGPEFDSELSLPGPLLKALLGIPLPVNEFLSIEKTALGQIVQAESAFEMSAFVSDTMECVAEERSASDASADLLSTSSAALDLEDLFQESLEETDLPPSVAPAQHTAPDASLCEGQESPILTPYGSDLEYLEDWFRFAANRIRIRKLELDENPRTYERDGKDPEQLLAEYRAREIVLKGRIVRRLELSNAENAWTPRVERLAATRRLDEFEKTILLTLIGANLSVEMQKAADSHLSSGGAEIGDVLVLWCNSLAQMVACRKYFRRTARLVKEGMIKVSEYTRGNFMRLDIEVDTRLLDYLVGLDVNAADLVEGSHLYTPAVNLGQVVLPADQKDLIVRTVSNFEAFKSHCEQFQLSDSMPYGRSLVMLFFGASGTGKTMMANALATKLGKRILLVNFPALGGMAAAEVLKMLFREARIQGAVIFFDECEALFQSRSHGNTELGLLLTEIERHDGLVIMATNRAFDLDEAMHRRITLAIEFRQPDPFLREEIWRMLIPKSVPVEKGIDFRRLAMSFELSGGFIKNAVLAALSLAVSRNNGSPLLTEGDLEQGARLQLRTRLRMHDFDRRVAPLRGLDSLVLPTSTRNLLEEIVLAEKARNVLFGQWGFDEMPGAGRGIAALFHGGPGTGKSLAAEAIGYEVGRPLTVVNCAELVSKYVGETGKNIESMFKEAANNESVLLFDEADGLFAKRTPVNGSSDRYANMDVGLLLYHVERFPGIVLMTTNLVDQVDEALFRRLRFIVEFPAPDQDARQELWRRLVPAKTPVASGLDAQVLARHPLTGGQIRNIVLRAAARAALRTQNARAVSLDDLEQAIAEELRNGSKARMGFLSA